MLFSIIVLTLSSIITDLVVTLLVRVKEKRIARINAESIEKEIDDAKNCEENVYIFRNLPEDMKKVVVEYLPPHFYKLLGSEAYTFLNNANTEQLRVYNNSVIRTYTEVFPKLIEYRHRLKLIRAIILTSIVFILAMIK